MPLVQIDDPTPPETLPCSVHTFVRPLERFPPHFEAKARSNAKGLVSPMKNERMLPIVFALIPTIVGSAMLVGLNGSGNKGALLFGMCR